MKTLSRSMFIFSKKHLHFSFRFEKPNRIEAFYKLSAMYEPGRLQYFVIGEDVHCTMVV